MPARALLAEDNTVFTAAQAVVAAPTLAGTIAQLSLRTGLAYVFLTFGHHKIVDWRGWATLLPPELAHLLESSSGLDLATLLHLLGYVEVILGLHLALGFFTRCAAAVSALLLTGVVLVMGSSGIGVRDVGLLSAAVAIALVGGGSWSLDAWLRSPATGGVRSIWS